MRTTGLLIAAFAGVLTIGLALPAQADQSGGSTATITISGGALFITVPGPALLGSAANAVDGATISGPLGWVAVDDTRGDAGGLQWTTSVTSTDFAPATGTPIPASAVSYDSRSVTGVGTGTYAGFAPTDVTGVPTPAVAVTATAINGASRATWNPMITVALPRGAVVGTYTATITHSVI